MPSNFDALLDELASPGRRPAPAPMRQPQPVSQRRPHSQPTTFTPSRGPSLAKALADATKLAQSQAALSREIAVGGGEGRLADIRSRARELVTQSKAEMLAAIKAGQMSATDAAEAEAYLNRFSSKMGL